MMMDLLYLVVVEVLCIFLFSMFQGHLLHSLLLDVKCADCCESFVMLNCKSHQIEIYFVSKKTYLILNYTFYLYLTINRTYL